MENNLRSFVLCMISSRKYSKKEIKRLMLCDTGSRWEPGSGAWAPVRGDARPPVFVLLHYGKVWETKYNWKNKTETSCLNGKTLKPLKRLLGSIRHLFALGFWSQGDWVGGLSLSHFPYFFAKSIDLLSTSVY